MTRAFGNGSQRTAFLAWAAAFGAALVASYAISWENHPKLYGFLKGMPVWGILAVPLLSGLMRSAAGRTFDYFSGAGLSFVCFAVLSHFRPDIRFLGADSIFMAQVAAWLFAALLLHRYREALVMQVTPGRPRAAELAPLLIWLPLAALFLAYAKGLRAAPQMRIMVLVAVPLIGALVRRNVLGRPGDFLHGLGLMLCAVLLTDEVVSWYWRAIYGQTAFGTTSIIVGSIPCAIALALHLFREEVWKWRGMGSPFLIFFGIGTWVLWEIGRGVMPPPKFLSSLFSNETIFLWMPLVVGLARKYWRGRNMEIFRTYGVFAVVALVQWWGWSGNEWFYTMAEGTALSLYFEEIADLLKRLVSRVPLENAQRWLRRPAEPARTAEAAPEPRLPDAGYSWWAAIAGPIVPILKKRWGAFAGTARAIWMEPQRRRRFEKALAALLLAILAVLGARAFVGRWVVTVTELTPKGLVPDTVMIRATFSEHVTTVRDVNELRPFNIDPPLEGAYSFHDRKTIVFQPTQPLAPATEYSVVVRPEGIRSAGRWMYGRAATKFKTEDFQVKDVRLFYDYDVVENVEQAVVGEINFNYPVDIERLRESLSIDKMGAKLPVSLEASGVASRFYFRAEGIARTEHRQHINLRIDRNLGCIGGARPLEKDFIAQRDLPALEKLKIEEVKMWQEPGNTFVAIKFNMPVAVEQVRQHLSVSPALAFEIIGEYAYAVLKGNFEPNKTYEISISAGLRAENGRILEPKNPRKPQEPYRYRVNIRDIPPYVRFADKGQILPLDENMLIEFRTMNLDKVSVYAEKVYRNNLVHFLRKRYYRGELGDQVHSGTFTIEGGQINEEVPSFFSLKNLHGDFRKGVFRVRVTGSGARRSAERMFIATDLGITGKTSGQDLHVFVHSLTSLKPVEGADVRLVSTNNQVIESKTTNAGGRVSFANWAGQDPLRAFVVTVEKAGDFSYLHMDSHRKEMQRWDVGGEPHTKSGIEAFVTSERQLYRPGDKVYVTAILRNRDMSLPPDIPVRFRVFSPRNRIVHEENARPDEQGIAILEFKASRELQTGSYRIEVQRIGDVRIGSTNVKIEEFIPDKIRVECVVPQAASYGKPIEFTVQAKQLFGAPAASAPVETSIRFLPREFSHEKYRGYRFSDPARKFTQQALSLGSGRLDERGEKRYVVMVPQTLLPPSMLLMQVYSEARDTGGRPVGAEAAVPVHRYPYYLGISTDLKGDGTVGKPVTIRYVATAADGQAEKVENVSMIIKRRSWYSIFRRAGWRQEFASSHYDEVLERRTLTIDGQGKLSFLPKVAGEYTVFLGNSNSMRTGITFRVWGVDDKPESLEYPEKLELEFSKARYRPGETATVMVRSPFAGTLILSVERERVFETFRVPIVAHSASVKVPISREFAPNSYVVAMVIRKPLAKYRNLPMISFGVKPLFVDMRSRSIGIEWDIPAKARAREPLEVRLKVKNATDASRVVLAAVDEGILQIVRFKTPDPLGFFYRKRALTTQTFSILDEVLPQLVSDKQAVGGGEGEAAPLFQRRHLNPIAAQRVKSFAFFSGVLKPGPDGSVRHKFDFKGFSGEVRLMALAVEGDKFGSSARAVAVADPVVVTPGIPRFMAPGDLGEMPVRIFNGTGREDRFTVSAKVSGPLRLEGPAEHKIEIARGREGLVKFPISAGMDAGKGKIVFRAQGASEIGESVTELPIRPAAPLFSGVNYGKLAPGQTANLEVPGGLIPQGQVVRLSASTNPLVLYLKSLDYLITYPYGCAEQITSSLFPLLYFKDLAMLSGRFRWKVDVDRFIAAGIKRLEKMQLDDGGFRFWPGGGAYSDWLTCYVSHFLLAANRANYQVDSTVMHRITQRLKQTGLTGTGRLDRRKINVVRPNAAYVLYLRALANVPDIEGMRSLRSKNPGLTDRALLSMAYCEVGDRQTGSSMIPSLDEVAQTPRLLGEDFVSPTRNAAMVLAALAGCSNSSKEMRKILLDFSKHLGERGHLGNTHENAWFWIAMGGAAWLLEATEPASLEVRSGDRLIKTLGRATDSWADPSLSGKTVELRNTAKGTVYFNLIVEGTPLQMPQDSVERGIRVERIYRDEEGRTVNLSNVAQGQLIVVTLSVKPHSPIDNVVIVDLLPAGFEIENPRLRSRGRLSFDPPCDLDLANSDFRDDRLILFTGKFSNTRHFSYAVRAVSPGHYAVPPLHAEAMYDPEIRGTWVCREPLVVAPSL